MSAIALTKPEKIAVRRSQFRRHQSAMLKKAKGRKVVVLTDRGGAAEKYVLDKRYFDELLAKFRSAVETLEITMDRRLFDRLLAARETLDQDIRRGKLHSFEEAFEEN